jgi:hypothetical protein
MNASTHSHTSAAPRQAPRLVLIKDEPDSRETENEPVRIVGSQPRTQGHFRLTDR